MSDDFSRSRDKNVMLPKAGNRSRAIKDDVESIPLHLLLQEATLWVKIQEADPPDGWTAELLSDQRLSLEEIREISASRHLDEAKEAAARERLASYCIMLRRRHDGRSASEIYTSRPKARGDGRIE